MLVTVGGIAPVCHPTSWIAPTAVVAGDVTVGAASSVWYSAVVRGDFDRIRIGDRSNLQDGAVLHTDDGLLLSVGAGVTVGHRAVLHGCVVEDDVLIGMGAIVMNGAAVGTGSIVAAGSLVPEGTRVPAGTLVRGVPARVVRATTDEEQGLIRLSAQIYAERAHLHEVPEQG